VCTRREFIPFLLGQENDKRVFSFDTTPQKRKEENDLFFFLYRSLFCRLHMLDNCNTLLDTRVTDRNTLLYRTHKFLITCSRTGDQAR